MFGLTQENAIKSSHYDVANFYEPTRSNLSESLSSDAQNLLSKSTHLSLFIICLWRRFGISSGLHWSKQIVSYSLKPPPRALSGPSPGLNQA